MTNSVEAQLIEQHTHWPLRQTMALPWQASYAATKSEWALCAELGSLTRRYRAYLDRTEERWS